MKSNKANKLGVLTIIFACLFMIVQRILISLTVIPEYAENPNRYYVYNIILSLTAVGGNLLALYIGYHSNRLSGKKPLEYLARFYLIYLILAMLINVVCLSTNIRDYWIILFPISQNLFGFSVSLILIFLVSTLILSYFDKISDQKLKNSFTLLSILFVVLPTLFGKDIFGFSDGKNILWVAYLFFMGYFIQRFNLVERYRKKYVQLIFSGLILSLSVIVMTRISLYLHNSISTANRFSVPWSLLSVYYSISLFILLENINSKFQILKAGFKGISTYLIITQILLNWPLVTYTLSEKYKEAFPNSASDWIKRIIFLIALYFVVSVVLVVLLLFIQKVPFYIKLEKKIFISNGTQLIEKLLKIKQWIYKRRRLFYVAVFFYFFTAIQMFLLSDYQNKNAVITSLLRIFTQRQAPLILNVIIIMSFFMLVTLVTKRFWYALTFTFMIDLLLTISTVIKVKLRTDPILPSDLVFITNISEIFSMISPVIVIVFVIVLILLSISTYIIQRRAGKAYNLQINNKKRIVYIVTLLTCFSGIFFINHQNSPSNLFFKLFIDDRHYFNQKNGAMRNGPLVQFIMNIDVKVMNEPSGYSKEAIKEIMDKYENKAAEINDSRNTWSKDQTVIFVLSESFSDPSRLPNVSLNKDPIPFVKSLSERTTSGLMLSSGYGGGTANMEWQSLTGMDMSNLEGTLPIPYTQLVNKQDISPTFLNLFDESIAIHPYMGTLYNRLNVFEKFGFDKFHYLGSPDGFKHLNKIDKNPYVSDQAAYDETIDAINGTNNKTQFIQLSTMQNHMPYDDYYEENEYNYDGNVISNDSNTTMNTYLKGLSYSDTALKNFISEIDKINKPITLVWYGDHLPGIYKDQELEKSPLLYRETDYFVYNNEYMQGNQKNEDYSIISPYNFSSLALEQANIKLTPFYALLAEITNKLPATMSDPNSSEQNTFNGQKIFVNMQNRIVKMDTFSQEQKTVLQDYMLIQYDLVAGKQYSAEWAMKKNSN